MVIMREIPLIPESQQVMCNINGIRYTFNIIWRDTGYILDILDVANNAIVQGLSLITGADLLAQLQYLNLNFILVIVTDVDNTLVPTYTSLGITSHLCVIYNG